MADNGEPKAHEEMMRTELPKAYPQPDPGLHSPCWHCRCFDCCCTGFCRSTAAPFPIRAADCLVTLALHNMGAYYGGEFSRERSEKRSKKNSSPPDPEGISGIISVDMFAPSVYEPGLMIPIRVFRKKNFTGPRKVLVFFHGGGWCVGHNFNKPYHKLGNEIASTGAVVVSVEYRLAPEFPFPAGLNDSFDVVRWIANGPKDEIFADCITSRIALSGDSAGGNFALVIATLMRDRLGMDLKPLDLGASVSILLLLYPGLMMDSYVDPDDRNPNDDYFLRLPVREWFFGSYVPGATFAEKRHLTNTDRRLCPLHAGFYKLPRTVIISGTCDPLRHANKIAADIMKKSGTDVVFHWYKSQPHGFVGFMDNKARADAVTVLIEELTKIE